MPSRLLSSSNALDASAPATARGDDTEMVGLFVEYRTSRDPAVRARLLSEHEWVAGYCARRFGGRGEPIEDLRQVALLGLLKAIDRFDPAFGTTFLTYAMPTVLGELRRHFRDATWAVRVPRRAKELYLELRRANDVLRQRLGRSPSLLEVATELDVPLEEVLDAVAAGNAYRTTPLVPPAGDDDEDANTIEDGITLGDEDAELHVSEDRLVIRSLLDELTERERAIVTMRFFGGLTQSEIAARIGVSQVQVSRLLRQVLARMRRRLATRNLPVSAQGRGALTAAGPALRART